MSENSLVFIIENDTVTYQILRDGMTVGRRHWLFHPDISITAKTVAGKQGKFVLSDNGWMYQDMSGMDSTWVNGVPLGAGNGIVLRENDVILCGNRESAKNQDVICMIYSENPGRTHQPWIPYAKNHGFSETGIGEVGPDGFRVNLPQTTFLQTETDSGSQTDGDNISNELIIDIRERTGSRRKLLLRDIHAVIHEGEIVAVLGGSGAGKTTFMNAVTGFEKADADIVFDGIHLYDENEIRRSTIKQVPQQDTLRDNDTVWKTLSDVGELFLPEKVTEDSASFSKEIEDVLRTFGLADLSNSRVAKLSGGQRKRLGVAVEYIKGPRIFFLDEKAEEPVSCY
jgi:ABC-type lipoprotein export system ATPase subunit